MSGNQNSVTAFLVDEIRRARIRADMTQEAFGRAAGFSANHVSSVETGARALTREFAKGADKALDTGGLFERALVNLASGHASWFQPWLTLELEARSMRQYEPAVVPGLLQTEDYMRTLMLCGGRTRTDQVESAVAGRLERQALLARVPPIELTFVVDEAALRRNIGGPEVMRAQLTHMLELIESGRIQFGVVPDGLGAHAGVPGNFMLARLPGGEAVGYSESSVAGHVVREADDLDILESRWTRLCMAALSRSETVDLIKKVAQWH